MKNHLIAYLLLLSCLMTTLIADEAQQKKAAEELLKSMNLESQISDSVIAALEGQMQRMGDEQQLRFKSFIKNLFAWEKIKDQMIPLYAQSFKLEELQQLNTFFQSPAGKKYSEQSATLALEASKITNDIMMQNREALMDLLRGPSPDEWIGKAMPELKVKYLGDTPELKGKARIVEFWATWCPPCRESIPHLNKIHKKYKDRGLAIIGISNEDEETVKAFEKTLPIDYFSAIQLDQNLSQKLNISGIPHAFIVDKNGKITWSGHPISLTDADIEKVL